MTVAKHPETIEAMLRDAHATLAAIKHARVTRENTLSESGDAWFAEVLGPKEDRIKALDESIAAGRTHLAALREKLTAGGMTQAELAAVWRRMQ